MHAGIMLALSVWSFKKGEALFPSTSVGHWRCCALVVLEDNSTAHQRTRSRLPLPPLTPDSRSRRTHNRLFQKLDSSLSLLHLLSPCFLFSPSLTDLPLDDNWKRDSEVNQVHFFFFVLGSYLKHLLDNNGFDNIGQRNPISRFLLLVMDPVLLQPWKLLNGDPVEEQRVCPVHKYGQQQGQRLVGYE